MNNLLHEYVLIEVLIQEMVGCIVIVSIIGKYLVQSRFLKDLTL